MRDLSVVIHILRLYCCTRFLLRPRLGIPYRPGYVVGSAKEDARIAGEKIGDSYNVIKQTILDSSQAVQETAEHAGDTAKEYTSLAGDEVVAGKDGIIEAATEASKLTKTMSTMLEKNLEKPTMPRSRNH